MPTQTTDPRLDQLRTAVRGDVLTPAHDAYDPTRTLFFSGFDHRPAAIVRVADAADVARTVTFARERGLELSVRSGGHGVAGRAVADGGVVIDLRDLTGLDVDVDGRTAWAQAGLTAGAYTSAVGVHGLATGFGDTASVGISGLTLAGGMGLLVRAHGLTIDHLLGAEVVTADGSILQVDADTHPDAFWALRGGGGTIGVVTRLHLRLHEVGTVTGGMLILPATADVVEGFVAAAEAAPEEVSTVAQTMVAPPMPMLPESVHGQPVVMGTVVHSGALADAEAALAPFRDLAEPLLDGIQAMPYPQLFEGEGPKPVHPSFHTMFLDHVDARTADTVVERITTAPADVAAVQLRVLGGAMARVPDDATAFAHRGRRIMVNVAATTDDVAGKAANDAWVAATAAALDQGVPGAYAGFLGDEGPARAREAYPGPTWERLVAVKRRYDPDDVFRGTHGGPSARG